MEKIEIIDGRVIVAVSGSMGLGQRIKAVTQVLWNRGAFRGVSPADVMELIQTELGKHLDSEWKALGMAARALGDRLPPFLSKTLIAIPLRSQLALFEFTYQGYVEEVTEQPPFRTIGTGQQTADLFLAFLRRIFWPDGLPA